MCFSGLGFTRRTLLVEVHNTFFVTMKAACGVVQRVGGLASEGDLVGTIFVAGFFRLEAASEGDW